MGGENGKIRAARSSLNAEFQTSLGYLRSYLGKKKLIKVSRHKRKPIIFPSMSLNIYYIIIYTVT